MKMSLTKRLCLVSCSQKADRRWKCGIYTEVYGMAVSRLARLATTPYENIGGTTQSTYGNNENNAEECSERRDGKWVQHLSRAADPDNFLLI